MHNAYIHMHAHATTQPLTFRYICQTPVQAMSHYSFATHTITHTHETSVASLPVSATIVHPYTHAGDKSPDDLPGLSL